MSLLDIQLHLIERLAKEEKKITIWEMDVIVYSLRLLWFSLVFLELKVEVPLQSATSSFKTNFIIQNFWNFRQFNKQFRLDLHGN